MCFCCFLSFCFFSGMIGLLVFFMFLLLLIEEEVGEFCFEYDNGFIVLFLL